MIQQMILLSKQNVHGEIVEWMSYFNICVTIFANDI